MTSSRSKKARRKKRMERKQQRFESFRKQLHQSLPDIQQGDIVIEPPGQVKMSDVLTRFVAKEMESSDTREATEMLLTLALMAWNMSFLPEQARQEMIDTALSEGLPTSTGESRADLKRFIEKLIVRKHKRFSKYTRWIISFELVDLEDGNFYLNVASTLEPQSVYSGEDL
jgi:hypothetical protein